MTAALIVLNPRAIPDCIQAIRALDIPTCWISYMPEPKAAEAVNHVIRLNQYDRYVLLSDDTLPTQRALDLVLDADAPGTPVVTGYCNLDQTDNRDIVNLTTNRLPPPPPEEASYQLMTRQQAEANGPLIPTTFAGLALTCMSRELWMTHPLEVSAYNGQMDYMLSYNLWQSGVPIAAANGAYVEHVKERWNHPDENPDKKLLVGERAPIVRWTSVEVAT
jgi:hypothetical protein